MASDVHKNTDTKVETVSANSVCRQLPQKTAEQGLAAAVAFAEEVQWSLAIRKTIALLSLVVSIFFSCTPPYTILLYSCHIYLVTFVVCWCVRR